MPDTNTMLAKVELAETEIATSDDLLAALDFIELMKAATKDAEERVKAAMIAHIKANGEIVSGTKRWWVGLKKKVKCRDAKKAIDTILMVSQGDEQRLLDCLSAGWFKQGTVKKLLAEFNQPELYDEIFEVTEDDELKDGTAKAPQLQCIDSRFLK